MVLSAELPEGEALSPQDFVTGHFVLDMFAEIP